MGLDMGLGMVLEMGLDMGCIGAYLRGTNLVCLCNGNKRWVDTNKGVRVSGVGKEAVGGSKRGVQAGQPRRDGWIYKSWLDTNNGVCVSGVWCVCDRRANPVGKVVGYKQVPGRERAECHRRW